MRKIRTCFVVSMCLLSMYAGGSREPVKISIPAWAGVGPVELAAHQCYFKKQGAEVKMVRFSAYTDSIDAFQEGKVDIGMQTLDDALRLAAGGKRLKVVLFTDFSYGAGGVVAREPYLSSSARKGGGHVLITSRAYPLASFLYRKGITRTRE